MNYEKRQASIARRLLKYSTDQDQNGCIHWIGHSDKNGYGMLEVTFENGKKLMRSHRLAYEQKNGPILDGLWVLHKCDKPTCINPNHLFLGTPKDNVQDMMSKKRNKCGKLGLPGEKNPKAKLTVDQVKAMRLHSNYIKPKDLAILYSMSVPNVRKIINHVYWKNV